MAAVASFERNTMAGEGVPEPDTIAAISTPPGRGGIGIVRLSGPESVPLARQVLLLDQALEHGRVRRAWVVNTAAANEVIDEALVSAFLAPNSYTGEDVVEIATHGSPVVLDTVLTALLRRGARLAHAGEFTQRAFLSGRLDLTQAEAVHDLIAAQTLEQARAAAQQLGGALSRRISPVKERLVQLTALLEAGMDFATGELDDVDVVQPEHILEEIQCMRDALEALSRSFQAGALLRSGVRMALVGRPNAGKSSLFNRLLERSRAIVTPVPGTTRDTVEETWSLAGIPVRLIDTAGLRLAEEPAADEAERQGIERSREALADADLVLLIHDVTYGCSREEEALIKEIEARPHLLVANKADLLTAEQRAAQSELAGQVAVSALTGEGIGDLRDRILHLLQGGGGLPGGGALNNRRQYESVLSAVSALVAAEEANRTGLPHEILLLELHTALAALDALTGQTTADDILARIFSTFCIGK